MFLQASIAQNSRYKRRWLDVDYRSRRLKIAAQRVPDRIDGTFLTAKRRRRFEGGALFIVNRRLRKSTGALSTLFNVRKQARTPHKGIRHPHAGATCVRAENSRREASIFTLRPLV